MKKENIITLFNTLADAENIANIGITGKKLDTFKSLSITFMTDAPIDVKTQLLASEYVFQYENTVDAIEKLENKNSALENQLADWKKKHDAVISGTWTLTKKVKGIERKYTFAELHQATVSAMNANDEKLLVLRNKKSKLSEIVTNEVEEIANWTLTDAESIAFKILRFELLNSKCLDIKNSFTELANACQVYNKEKLKGLDTKDSYMSMKKEFSNLANLVKVTKESKGEFMNVKTFSFNQEETKILAETLFSAASIGQVDVNGEIFYNLLPDGRSAILKNIVKIVIMKLQGVKITLENI